MNSAPILIFTNRRKATSALKHEKRWYVYSLSYKDVPVYVGKGTGIRAAANIRLMRSGQMVIQHGKVDAINIHAFIHAEPMAFAVERYVAAVKGIKHVDFDEAPRGGVVRWKLRREIIEAAIEGRQCADAPEAISDLEARGLVYRDGERVKPTMEGILRHVDWVNMAEALAEAPRQSAGGPSEERSRLMEEGGWNEAMSLWNGRERSYGT